MTRQCAQCGVTSQGAFLAEVDGELLCSDCAEGECERCGAQTSERTLSGSFRCENCQQQDRDQDSTREGGQAGLSSFSGGEGQ